MKFSELKDKDKVVDIIQPDRKRLDGQILEYRKDKDNMEYLCSDKSLWPIYQFSESDYERYEGELPVGAYITGWIDDFILANVQYTKRKTIYC